jgi:hypothetical protein
VMLGIILFAQPSNMPIMLCAAVHRPFVSQQQLTELWHSIYCAMIQRLSASACNCFSGTWNGHLTAATVNRQLCLQRMHMHAALTDNPRFTLAIVFRCWASLCYCGAELCARATCYL